MLLHFRKHFLVHLSHLLWSSSKSMKWRFVFHFIARKLRLREIKITERRNILQQSLKSDDPVSKLVQMVLKLQWFNLQFFYFLMAQKPHAIGRNHSWNLGFGSVPGLVVCTGSHSSQTAVPTRWVNSDTLTAILHLYNLAVCHFQYRIQ